MPDINSLHSAEQDSPGEAQQRTAVDRDPAARPGSASTSMRQWLRGGKWLAGLVGGAIAAPIGIMLHEVGHFSAYVACGFPETVLRFSPGSPACCSDIGSS